jgi:hypothetical protein
MLQETVQDPIIRESDIATPKVVNAKAMSTENMLPMDG